MESSKNMQAIVIWTTILKELFLIQNQLITNPILEIDEYDVVAGHGASVGDVSQEEIYYLMSRGLTYEQSKN